MHSLTQASPSRFEPAVLDQLWNGKDSFAEEGTGLVWLLLHFLLPQTMLPSNDQITYQSCSFGQQKMTTLLGVVEKYTCNRLELSESVPLDE